MARPLRIQFPGAFYYVSQRSNSGSHLFLNDGDKRYYLETLQSGLATYTITLHAFVMLKDHLHLIVETPQGNLSEFMRHINIRYTSYFNRVHGKNGSLFRGRYKSLVFEKQTYLFQLASHLHLNPVRVGTYRRARLERKKNHLLEYRWSSLPGYLGNYPRYPYVNHNDVLHPHGGDTPQGRHQYATALFDLLENPVNPRKNSVAQAILGSGDFIEDLRPYLQTDTTAADHPAQQQINNFVLRDKVLKEIGGCLRCSIDEMLNEPGEIRSITMEMLYRFGSMTNHQIGKIMELDYTSVSAGRKKLRTRRESNPLLNGKITMVEKRLARMITSNHRT